MTKAMTLGLIGGVVIVLIFFVFTFSLKDKNGNEVKNSSDSTNTSEVKFSKVSPIEFKTKIEQGNSVILDLRTPQEFSTGYISRPLNIDFYSPTFQQELEKLDREASYLIYCNSGNRSGQTLSIMKQLGFKDVTDLQGGITSWKISNLEINQ